jgi:hypothetical protein
MKKILYIRIVVLLSFCFYACDESFLDTTPTDTYTEGIFWKNEVHAVAAINACYAVTRNSNIGGVWKLRTENYSPNSYSSGGNVALAMGNHNAGNIDIFKSRWDANYEGIGRVNNLLANIDQVQMNQTIKQRIIGEAYFLRALFYSDMVNYFGGVPLILDAPDFDKQKNLPRNSREDVIKQILIDLDNAAEILPLPGAYSGADIGRATKGAALALKARVLLYESRWVEAAAAAKKVIDLEVYDLFPDYRGLFLLENEGNQEVIFDVQYLEPEYTHRFDVIIELQINVAPTLDLVNSYLMKDGKPIQESPLYDPSNPYENRDPRLLKTVVIPGYLFRGEIVRDDKYFSTGYGLKKYTTYKDEEKGPDFLRSEINYQILRYAEVLLMYAEAQNEAGGPDISVYSALNKIRNRAGMPDITEGLSKEEMREVIRLERRIEFAGEGLYYDDIRRWRTAEIVMNADVRTSTGEVVQTRTFDPQKHYLWPIHAVVLQENPALEQNPGF